MPKQRPTAEEWEITLLGGQQSEGNLDPNSNTQQVNQSPAKPPPAAYLLALSAGAFLLSMLLTLAGTLSGGRALILFAASFTPGIFTYVTLSKQMPQGEILKQTSKAAWTMATKASKAAAAIFTATVKFTGSALRAAIAIALTAVVPLMFIFIFQTQLIHGSAGPRRKQIQRRHVGHPRSNHNQRPTGRRRWPEHHFDPNRHHPLTWQTIPTPTG